MKRVTRPLGVMVLGAWIGLGSAALALSEAEQALFKAAAAGNAKRLSMGLSEVDPNVRNAQGQTLLMTAAKAGRFDCLQALVWGGADARLKSKEGKLAKDYLNRKGAEFVECNLLLRCYAYVRSLPQNRKAPARPSLVVISDNYIDHDHPKLKGHYHVNTVEQGGKKGVDDDRNGFIDDVYGWNFAHNQPTRPPELAIDRSPETMKVLQTILDDFEAINKESDPKRRQARLETMQNMARNPLIQQIGAGALAKAGILIDDFKYYLMWSEASHGTHVAGIVVDASVKKAKVTCATHGIYKSRAVSVLMNAAGTVQSAKQAEDFGEYVQKVIEMGRSAATRKGSQASRYLQQIGAGVVNMSWEKSLPVYQNTAKQLENLYRVHGKKPESIKSLKPGEGLDHTENLALELTVADAAMFATVFYQNPNVLFVLAAGNATQDNDKVLPSPAYLSRFFPNVITVASHSRGGIVSGFSNYGIKSVQIAAMGEDVDSAILADLEAPMSGTSMAAPKVAGVAARIRAEHPEISASDLRRILERSAQVTAGVFGKVTTSGILDDKKALAMASTWGKGNIADLLIKPKKEPGLKIKINLPKKPVAPIILKPLDLKPAQPVRRITAVAGRGNEWRLGMSQGSPYTLQTHSGINLFPLAWIQKKWKDGLRITSIAGSAGAWNVTMSTGVPGKQWLVGYEFDQTLLKEHMDAGRRITSLGGWKDSWLIVVSSETGWGRQRYTLPTPMTESRISWIKKRWAEGYQITGIAGDDDPSVEDDGWLIVMTQETKFKGQTIFGPGPWPGLKMLTKQREGYQVTTLAGSKDRWVVVMSKGSGLKNQVFSAPGPYPSEWVDARWHGRTPKTK